MNRLRATTLAVHGLIACLLGACASGGGGGGGAPITPLPPPPVGAPRPPAAPIPPLPPAAAPGSTPDVASAEFTNNWGPGGIHAETAWQYENAHGEGVLIGVVDDGVHPDEAELLGRISPDSTDIRTGRNALTSSLTHGTELSSLIAGNFNGDATVGVAYEATILAVRADNGLGGYDSADLARAVDYAVAHGVKVINLSLGSPSVTEAVFQNAIERATAAGVIVVVSAGNDGPFASEPNYPGFLATNAAVSHGLMLIAGGLNKDGTFNTRSNPAGSAAQFYLTAPGWEIVVPDYGAPGPLPGFQVCYPNPSDCSNGLVEIQGTSYASPHVVGAIAILMSAFPGLTPQQVVQLVLQTSDDMGGAGIDSQTGWGRLNLQRAFQPVGAVAAPLMAGALDVTSTTSLGAAGPAFGDGLTNDPGEWVVSGFDRFGRTYSIDLASNWRRSAPGLGANVSAPLLWQGAHGAGGVAMQFAPADDVVPDSLTNRFAREDVAQPSVRLDAELASGLTLSYATNHADNQSVDAADAVGHMAFVNADQSLRLSKAMGERFSLSFLTRSGEAAIGLNGRTTHRSANAVELGFAAQTFGLSATYGDVREGEGVLGLAWSDAFGVTPGGAVRFASIAGHAEPAPGWRIGFDAQMGQASFASSGWLKSDAPLVTSSYAIEARYALTPAWAAGDGAVTLSIQQPLRIEAGELLWRAPVSDAYGRQHLHYETRVIDVAPSGRETRFGFGYQYGESGRFSGFAEALYVLEPGHVADADAETLLRVGLRMRR